MVASVLLPSRQLRPSGKLREKFRKFRENGHASDSNSGTFDESDADSGSEANEYADGLGCADARRCSQVSSSGFAFDDHPREEYFEEPKSMDMDMASSMQELAVPQCGRKRPLSSLLLKLEAKEAREEAERQQKYGKSNAMQKQGQGAKRHKVEPKARGQAVRLPARPCQSKGMTSEPDSKESLLAQLRAHCACLFVIRSRAHGAQAPRDSEEDRRSALNTLASLMQLEVGVAELRATGIGRELAKASWQQHESREVALQSQCLVAKWRQAAGLGLA
mmetsp:Transcript_96365/g.171275  ORF Transcript_96365/g.171275 Transcript_96365/m.171275 type:complete len:277 (-) Transcript_96365:188-1018(-)